MMAALRLRLMVSAVAAGSATGGPAGTTIYVSPGGSDSRDGATRAEAVLTLHRARELVREKRWVAHVPS